MKHRYVLAGICVFYFQTNFHMLKYSRGDIVEQDKLLKLYQSVVRARKIELDLLDLNKKEVALQKDIKELEQARKPKKSFFRFHKKDTNGYEKNQAKTRYAIAVRELSDIQDSIRVKSDELSSLQIAKEEFSKMYEKKLAVIKISEKHREKLKILETAYLTSVKRKELLPEAKEKAWWLQYQIQNIVLILRQAVEAYNADVRNGISQYNRFERIDKAKEEIEKLEKMLGEFQSMLNEMELKFEMQIDTKNFVSYAREGNKSFWTDSRILTLQVRECVKETLKEFEEKEVQTDNFRKELIMMEERALWELYENQNCLEEFVIFSI